jgi:SAM-dependent methyltransferase
VRLDRFQWPGAPRRISARQSSRDVSSREHTATGPAISWLAAALIAVAAVAPAQDFPQYGDELYRPKLRQQGKDVMWLPTPDAMVTRMLQAAKVTASDHVVDLGAGEGRIPIAAAKAFGAKATGIEYDADLAALARRNAVRAGVADRVAIVTGDIFKEDFSRASVVTMYLLPELNQQLRPQLLKMKPGTRIVSHMWDMGEWEPDEAFSVDDSDAYLWIVPAQVAGRWKLESERNAPAVEINLTQQFQRIGGTMTIGRTAQPLLGAYVRGDILGFTYVDRDGGVRSARVRVDGDSLRGHLRFAGNLTPLTGMRE